MLNIILLFYLLLIALALGKVLLRWIGLKAESFLEESVFAIGAGLTVLAYAIYFLGLLKFLYKGVLWLSIFVLTLLLLPKIWGTLGELYEKGKTRIESFNWKGYGFFSYVVASFFILHALFNLIGALAPETIFDAIWYHLALPKIYLANYKIFFVPYVKYAAFPRVAEMLYTLAMGLYSDVLAKLIHYSMGLLITAGIYSLFRRYFSPKGGLFAAAIFYIMQPVNMLSQTAYVDLALTFYEFLAAYALANWWFLSSFAEGHTSGRINAKREGFVGCCPPNVCEGTTSGGRTPQKGKRWLILAGVFAGISLGVKHQAVLLLATVFLLLFLYFLFKEKKAGVFVSSLFTFGVPAVLLVLPWYVDSYLNTGNPFYPLFNTVFGTGESFEKAMFASTGKSSWYAGHSLLEYFTLLWKFTMGNYEGWLSPLFIFFLPAAFLVKEKPKIFKLSLLFALLFYTFYYGIVPFYTVRYFLPAAPILSLITAFLLLRLFEKDGFLRVVCVGVVLLAFAMNLGMLAFKTLPATPTAFGFKNRETYLSETLIWYDVNRFIRENVTVGHKVLVSGAPLFYYFDFNYVYGSGPKADSYYELASKLKKQGFTHSLLLVGALDDPEAAQYFHLVYSKDMSSAVRSNAARGAKLYEIRN